MTTRASPISASESVSAAVEYREDRDLPREQVLALYRANGWSAADKPEALLAGLGASHALVTAWDGARLVGLGNAISDGHLVVYYPHLLVLPAWRGRGIGRELMRRLMARYEGFHMQMLTADGGAVEFYRRCGFEQAGATEAMWIYGGADHG